MAPVADQGRLYMFVRARVLLDRRDMGPAPGQLGVTVGIELESAMVTEQHLTRRWPPDAAIMAVAGYVLNSFVNPTMEMAIGGIDLPAIDDPELEPDAFFTLNFVESGLTYNTVTVFGDLD